MIRRKIAGRKMWLDVSDGGISKRLLKTNGNREPGFQWILKHEARGVALDIGANIGWYSVLLAERCHSVYAFEPDPRSYRLLKKNVEHRQSIRIEPSAITDKLGDAPILLDKRPNLSRVGVGEHIVRTMRIDDIPLRVNFVKMDIEGGEVGAFRGAHRVLCEDGPGLLVEVHPQYYSPEKNFAQELEWCVENGYRFKYLVNAKGKQHVFAEHGYTPRKAFKNYPKRAVYADIPARLAIPWCTQMPADGKKIIRSFFLCKD